MLAGDHRQLAPTVHSDEAARSGLSMTLFDRLLRRHGAGIARMLTVQYRMHADICQWASNAMYGGRLVAAPTVAAPLAVTVEAPSTLRMTTLLMRSVRRS